MKLSEAIKQSCELFPQGFGDYSLINDEGELCLCALGMAYYTAYGHIPLPRVHNTDTKTISKQLLEVFPVSIDTLVDVTEWNDSHWTIPAIINELESRGQ